MILNAAELRSMFKVNLLADDDRLLALLIAAEDEAERRCGTVLEAEDITEYQDGDATCELLLKNSPVNSIASIHDDIDRDYAAASLIAADDYTFERHGRVALDSAVFSPGRQNVKVVYNAGYSEIPYDLKVAVGNIAFANYLEANGSINTVEGQEVVYRPGKLRTAADKILDRFVKMV